MRRVLMICYYFPPLGGVGSMRALKFAQYLPDFGWDPTIIAPRNGAYYRDLTLRFDEEKVVRTGSLEISRTVKQMVWAGGNDTRPARVGPMLEHIRRIVRRWVYRPDGQIGWYPFAVRGVRRVLREGKLDAIFSSSPPITAHIIAHRAHQQFGIPWVAEFRDLWTDLCRYDSRSRQRIDAATERALLEAASAVVTVSEAYARIFLDRGARRVSVITNGFDPVDFPGRARSHPPVATYVGTYYPDRQDLRTVLQAIGELIQSGLVPGLRVRFVGDLPESLREALAQADLTDSVECTGFVPYRDVLGYLEESALLLLAGPVAGEFPGSKVRGNIAGKVFEYLGSRRPILYVGQADAEVENIIRRFPGIECVRPGDAKGSREAIVSLIQQGPMVDRGSLERYTRRSLTSRLAEILDGTCSPPRGVRVS